MAQPCASSTPCLAEIRHIWRTLGAECLNNTHASSPAGVEGLPTISPTERHLLPGWWIMHYTAPSHFRLQTWRLIIPAEIACLPPPTLQTDAGFPVWFSLFMIGKQYFEHFLLCFSFDKPNNSSCLCLSKRSTRADQVAIVLRQPQLSQPIWQWSSRGWCAVLVHWVLRKWFREEKHRSDFSWAWRTNQRKARPLQQGAQGNSMLNSQRTGFPSQFKTGQFPKLSGQSWGPQSVWYKAWFSWGCLWTLLASSAWRSQGTWQPLGNTAAESPTHQANGGKPSQCS